MSRSTFATARSVFSVCWLFHVKAIKASEGLEEKIVGKHREVVNTAQMKTPWRLYCDPSTLHQQYFRSLCGDAAKARWFPSRFDFVKIEQNREAVIHRGALQASLPCAD